MTVTIEPGAEGYTTPGRPQPLLEQIAEENPAKADAVIALAAGLIDQAGPLWDALVGISEANTAKPFAELITDQVLTAALTLT